MVGQTKYRQEKKKTARSKDQQVDSYIKRVITGTAREVKITTHLSDRAYNLPPSSPLLLCFVCLEVHCG